MSKLIEIMADQLRLDSQYINTIVNKANFYYKDYCIKKKSGGIRHISQASPELKTIQYWIVYNILNQLPVSDSAFAYKKGDSIKKHASFHKDSNYLFHTDITNFFESIHPNMLERVLREHERPFLTLGTTVEQSLETISKACFRNNNLCIGTVSSPTISNVIMYEFDNRIKDYCNSRNLLYSRYADDIYISSKSFIPIEIRDKVSEELCKTGFKMNGKKTWFKSMKNRRTITGLILTTEHKVTIGSDNKNYIKKLIYERLIHKRGNTDIILGYLAYLKDIEPYTYDRILIKYSGYCRGDIIEALKGREEVEIIPPLFISFDD